MNLEQLRQAGAFVDPAPVREEVEWTHKTEDGETVTEKFAVHVRRQSFGAVDRLFSSLDDRSRSAWLISQSVLLGPEAREQFTYDDAYQLDPGLAYVLIDVINRVNTAKNSPPPTPSGTN